MFNLRRSDYTKLVQEDLELEQEDSQVALNSPTQSHFLWDLPPARHRHSWRTLALISLALNTFCGLSFGFWMLAVPQNHGSPLPEGQLVYSPANDVLEKIPIVFQSAIAGRSETKYQGPPSPELDALWEDLYGFGISKITANERSQMINKTDKILIGDKPEYVVQLAVFHQLHCINMLRMKLSSEYYEGNGLMDDDHLSHCIDSLRQAVSCSADVTPFVWRWSEAHNQYMGRLDVVHSCRNFEAIKDWARPRAVVVELNKTHRVLPVD